MGFNCTFHPQIPPENIDDAIFYHFVATLEQYCKYPANALEG